MRLRNGERDAPPEHWKPACRYLEAKAIAIQATCQLALCFLYGFTTSLLIGLTLLAIFH